MITSPALPRTADRSSVPGTATFHGLVYLVSALPLAGLWLAILITGWVFGLVLAITPLLPAVLIGFCAVVRFAAWIEGYLARRLLRAATYPRRLGPPRRGYWASVGGVLGSGAFWRGQVFLLLRVVLGIVTGTVALSVVGSGLFLLAAPIVYRFLPADEGANGIDFEIWKADSLGEAFLLVPAGLVLLVVAFGLVHLLSAMWRGLAVGLLGGDNG